ncbi:MAG TPA: STAS domain-containing protein [Solirubrobacteraceae bacterium]|jgi:anti-anti-sigma factor|nr:STAS domain-containing protein [Solirubrobacteraceae bacterium]
MTRFTARRHPSHRPAEAFRAIDHQGPAQGSPNQLEAARRARGHRERGRPPSPGTPLRVHTLELTGQLGHNSAASLEAAIDDICAGGIDRLVIDLRALTAIDRTGVDVIAMRCRLCRRRGVIVELIAPKPQLMGAFEAAGVGQELPFFGDENSLLLA